METVMLVHNEEMDFTVWVGVRDYMDGTVRLNFRHEAEGIDFDTMMFDKEHESVTWQEIVEATNSKIQEWIYC